MSASKIKRLLEYANLIVFGATTISLIALNQEVLGFSLLILGIVSLWGCGHEFRRNILLLYACLLVLFIIPIGTTTAFPQAFYMGVGLATVVLMPLLVSRKIYKNNLITPVLMLRRNVPTVTASRLFIESGISPLVTLSVLFALRVI